MSRCSVCLLYTFLFPGGPGGAGGRASGRQAGGLVRKASNRQDSKTLDPGSTAYRDDGNFRLFIDRDLNASLNIRNIGINTVGHTGINACGDSSLEPSLKQEKEGLVN